MKQINDENIDEIMFQLLEGEITGFEREQLLTAIEADEAYSNLWQAWQQTILTPELELPVMNIRQLKKKTARVIPFNFRYAIAAMLVLGLGLAVFLVNQTPGEITVSEVPKPAQTKQPVKQIPKPEIKTPEDTRVDSLIPLKEKIRSMADIQTDKTNEIKQENIPATPITTEIKSTIEHDKIVEVTDTKNKLKEVEVPENHIIVTMSNDSKPAQDFKKDISKPKQTFLSRIFGTPKFKLENDSNTRTNRRLIIENKQYKIIAGF